MTMTKAEQYCSLFLVFTLGFWRTGINIMLGVLLIFFLIRLFKKEKILSPVLETSFIKTGLLYFATYLVSFIFSSNHLASSYNLVWLLSRFLPFIIVWFVIQNKIIRNQFWNLIALGIICSSIIVFIQQSYGWGNIGRPNGFLGVLNFAGAVGIITSCLFPFILSKNKTPNQRLFFIAAIILANIALFFNGTRGIILANAVTYILAAYLYFGFNKKTLLVFLIMSLVIFGGLFSSKSSRGSLVNVSSQGSVSTRLEMLTLGWSTFKDNLIFGAGPGMSPNYNLVYPAKGKAFIEVRERTHVKDFSHLHNLYMQTLAEMGILGFVGLLVFYGNLLFIFYTKLKSNLTVFACFFGLLSFLLHGMTDYVYQFTSEMILIFFVVAIGLFESSEENKVRSYGGGSI